MTRNDHSNQLEWSIRARSGRDAGQGEWGNKCKVFLHVDRVLLAGKIYAVDNLKDLPLDLSPGHLATNTSVPSMVRFFGRASMLSNHSQFKIDGISFTGGEQFHHKKKSDAFGDSETAAKVMSTADPLKQFIYGSSVHGLDLNV